MQINNEKRIKSILKGYNMLLNFAGSMISYEPTDECVTDFWSDGIIKTLPVSSSNPRFVLAASQLRESCSEKPDCLNRLRKDYRRLFLDPVKPLASPVSTEYNKNNPTGKSRYDVNVTAFYESYGWKPGSSYKLPDVHLGTKLLFLSLLIDKYTKLDDKACQSEMGKEIRRFITAHILSWIPEWNEKMQLNAETLCYKGISSLIYACTEDLFYIL